MIDDSRLDPREQAGERHYGEGLLYDFAKYLTGLSLVLLGGLLTLTDAARAGQIDVRRLAVVVGAAAIGGVLSFSVASGIVDARARGREPARSLPLVMKLAAAFLGVGTGTFLATWLEGLR